MKFRDESFDEVSVSQLLVRLTPSKEKEFKATIVGENLSCSLFLTDENLKEIKMLIENCLLPIKKEK